MCPFSVEEIRISRLICKLSVEIILPFGEQARKSVQKRNNFVCFVMSSNENGRQAAFDVEEFRKQLLNYR